MENNDATDNTTLASDMLSDEQLDNMSEDEMLDVFVEQLIFDKGLTDLHDDLKQEVHKDLKERLVYQINAAMVAALPEEKLDELNKKLDEKTADAEYLNKLVEEAGIDAENIVKDTMVEFRNVYLNGDAAEAKDEPAEKTEE